MSVYQYRNTGTNQVVYVQSAVFAGNPLWELISGPGSGGGDVTQADLDALEADSTGPHGVADFAELVTDDEASAKVQAHSADTTSVHGIADTAVLETQSGAQFKASAAQAAAIAASVPLSQKGAANGVATLGSDSKIPSAQVPAITLTDYLGPTANQAAMLALVPGQLGDWTIRTDLSTTWVISGADATQLSNWTQLGYPNAVTQVAGKTGIVTLAGEDITSGTVAVARLPVGTDGSSVAAGNDIRITGAATASALTSGLAGKVAKGELVFNVSDYDAVADGSTSDRTAIQAAITAAAAVGGTVMLHGDHAVAGIIDLAAGVTLDGSQGSLTQTSSLTITLRVNSVNDVVIRNVRVEGLGSDYVNTSTVYLAAGISVSGTSTRVIIDGCYLINNAGAGVLVGPAVSKVTVRDCRITGPGAPPIVGTTSNFGGGIVLNANGPSELEVSGCDISQYAQGIVTGDCSQVRIRGNHIHDIVGQHGIYLDSVADLVLADNIIRNTVLQGVKIQLALGGTPDTTQVSITGNVITSAGSHALLLTRLSGTPRLRRIAVVGNTFSTSGVGGDGINCIGVEGAVLANNTIYNARTGISLSTCAGLIIAGNRVDNCSAQGVFITSSTDIQLLQNRIANVATADDPTNEFGVYLVGVGTAGITIDGNVISDTGTHMKYGIYVVTNVTQDTVVIRNNDISGATDYAVRLDSTQGLKEWANNVLGGTIGEVTGFPTALVVKGKPVTFLATAAPSVGTFRRGDIVWNTTPSAAGVPGWVCTTAGSPGTWKAMAALAA